jgi:hypothetical protein
VDEPVSEVDPCGRLPREPAHDAGNAGIATIAWNPARTPTRIRPRSPLYVEVAAAVVLVLVISAMLAGLSGRAAPAAGSGNAGSASLARDDAGTTVDLPSSGWPRGHGDPLASPFSAMVRADGDLDGGCVWLEAIDGARITALWPIGYRARFDQAADPVVIDEAGRVVATADLRAVGFVLPWRGDLPSRCVVSTDRVIAVVR